MNKEFVEMLVEIKVKLEDFERRITKLENPLISMNKLIFLMSCDITKLKRKIEEKE